MCIGVGFPDARKESTSCKNVCNMCPQGAFCVPKNGELQPNPHLERKVREGVV